MGLLFASVLLGEQGAEGAGARALQPFDESLFGQGVGVVALLPDLVPASATDLFFEGVTSRFDQGVALGTGLGEQQEIAGRAEERRAGKECRSRGWPYE